MQDADNLTFYRVTLVEQQGDRFFILFECYAEDYDHAVEQTLNAYPSARIENVRAAS